MAEQFTPGPWMEGPTEGIGQRGKLTVVDSRGRKVADCESARDGLVFQKPYPEDTANARLVAAAPELLNELRATVQRLEKCIAFSGSGDPDFVNAATQKARELIRKAEGR